MSNADFDTRNTSPGTRQKPAETAENTDHRPPDQLNPRKSPSGTRPTPPPATTGDSPKPPYLQAIHYQFSPPRGSLQKSCTRSSELAGGGATGIGQKQRRLLGCPPLTWPEYPKLCGLARAPPLTVAFTIQVPRTGLRNLIAAAERISSQQQANTSKPLDPD